jgi:hypothetical protein
MLGPLIIMSLLSLPWENSIVFICLKCAEYRERVQQDNLKDERKMSSTNTSGASKGWSVELIYYGSIFFSHLQKAALTLGSISSEQSN